MSVWKKDAESTTTTGVKGVLHVESRSLRDSLTQVTNGALDDMKSALAKRAAAATAELLDEARTQIKWLDERPDDLDSFAIYKERFQNSRDRFVSFHSRLEDLLGKQEKGGNESVAEKFAKLGMYGILKFHNYKLPIPDKVALDNLEEEKAKLDSSVAEARTFLSSVQQMMNSMLTQDISSLQEELLETMAALASGPLLDPNSPVPDMLSLIEEHNSKIEVFESDCERFGRYQLLFKMPKDNFDNLELVKKDFQKHHTIWTSLAEWQGLTHTWLNSKTGEIDLESLQSKADEFARLAYKLNKTYKVTKILFGVPFSLWYLMWEAPCSVLKLIRLPHPAFLILHDDCKYRATRCAECC